MSFKPPDGTTNLRNFQGREAVLVNAFGGQRAVSLAGMGNPNFGDLFSDPTYTCGSETCPANSSASHAWQIRVADVPYNRVVPAFYHVAVTISTPLLHGGPYGCTTFFLDGELQHLCGFTDPELGPLYDTPLLHGEVAVDGDGLFLEASGLALSRAFDGELEQTNHTQSTTQAEWPDIDPSTATQQGTAYLVNPGVSPWPVPDALGNTFGRCVFTAAQLPAAVDLAMTRYNRWYQGEGVFAVEVGAYLLSRRLRGVTTLGPGSPGRRLRGRVVGQGGRGPNVG